MKKFFYFVVLIFILSGCAQDMGGGKGGGEDAMQEASSDQSSEEVPSGNSSDELSQQEKGFPQNVGDFTSIYGVDVVNIGDESVISGGVVGSGGDINIGKGVMVNGDMFAEGNLYLAEGSVVQGKVFVGGTVELAVGAEIKGEVVENSDLVPVIDIPEMEVTAGDENIVVQPNQKITIQENDYKYLRVLEGGILILKKGEYGVKSVVVASGADLKIGGPTKIMSEKGFVIAGKVEYVFKSIEPKNPSFVLYTSHEKATLIRTTNMFKGLVYVPFGELNVGAKANIKGKLWGKVVKIKDGVKIEVVSTCVKTDEICGDNIDQDCDGLDIECGEVDQDADGYLVSEGDCDDYDATINPGAVETCDLVDNNCDGSIDNDAVNMQTWFEDKDGDGYGVDANSVVACQKPAGYAGNTGDCNDDNNGVSPGTIETCDGVDNNCSGAADEDLLACKDGQPIPVPPDPQDIAPPADTTEITTIKDAAKIIYDGDTPIQVGVVEGAIDEAKVSIIRGKILTDSGQPLPAVSISILDHPELGSTMSRMDGVFDLVVNSGFVYVIKCEREGYLPAQRRVEAPLNDYMWMEDVAMIAVDKKVTSVALTAAIGTQVAEGSVVSDKEGERQGVLLVPQDTTASMELPNGTTEPVGNIDVRITEYTVGEDGPDKMPGALPPNIAYTYAIELSTDEGIAANATTIKFNKELAYYVENFLGFPIGTPVPLGYYDKEKGLWVPSKSGIIIKIIDIVDGKAKISMKADESEATEGELTSLGVTVDELQYLAAKYPNGQSLWRMPIAHFSAWDANWAWGPPANAEYPGQPEPTVGDVQNVDPCKQSGSIIGCESQTLGEAFNIVGTPFALHYQSDRVSGASSMNTVNIPISGEQVPESLERIDIEVSVAGKLDKDSKPALPNQIYTYVWDGINAYGQEVQGEQLITIKIGYVYKGVYEKTDKFGYNGGGMISGSQTRQEATLWQEWKGTVGAWNAGKTGLGGWQLNVHHAYDPVGKTLYYGDGRQRRAKNINNIIQTVAGSGIKAKGYYLGDEGPAIEATFYQTEDVAFDYEGNMYIVDITHTVRKVDKDGIIHAFAGKLSLFIGDYQPSGGGDGGQATNAGLNYPSGLACDSKGNVYIADGFNYKLRKVDKDGVITAVAGTGAPGFTGDGGLATQATLGFVRDVAIDKFDNLYIIVGNRIRKIDAAGIITSIAGNNSQNYGYDGPHNALDVGLCEPPESIDVDNFGNVYVVERVCNRIRKITPDGQITVIAGGGENNVEGAPALEAKLIGPYGVTVNKNGEVYFSENSGYRIRKISFDGKVYTIAGNGKQASDGDGGPATDAGLYVPSKIAFDNKDNLYAPTRLSNTVRKISHPFPGVSNEDYIIASEDGSEVYHFNNGGKHLDTKNTLTGAIEYNFVYSAAGLLASIADEYNNITSIERDVSGKLTGLISPYGQKTKYELNATDFIKTIENPKGEKIQFEYDVDGLLVKMTDAKNNTYNYTYNDKGKLIKDLDPLDGFKALSRQDVEGGYDVTVTTALNRATNYDVEFLEGGIVKRSVIDPAGVKSESVANKDTSATSTFADGVVAAVENGPDPRFGMQSPIAKKRTVKMPSGLTFLSEEKQSATLLDNDNLLSLNTKTKTLTINGNVYTTNYNSLLSQTTMLTPELRTVAVDNNLVGDMTKFAVKGFEPVNYVYDVKGRLVQNQQKDRIKGIGYNPEGFIDYVSDPLTNKVYFTYDGAGNVVKMTLPDNREISYLYDANGNMTSITPPSKPNHSFLYNAVDLATSYLPPDAGLPQSSTQYEYNLDRDLEKIIRPDGKKIDFVYDAAGRIGSVIYPEYQLTYGYNQNTGKLENVSMSNGETILYSYDGWLLNSMTWQGPVGGNVEWKYDNNFRIIQRKLNGANAVGYVYDKDGLLSNAGQLAISRSLDNGSVVGSALGNAQQSITYNEFAEVSGRTTKFEGSDIYSASYTRDKLGRIVQKIESVSGVGHEYSYEYDVAGRLFESVKDGVVTIYTYDDNSNRTLKDTQGNSIAATYDAQDRMISYGTTQYTYTPNGELTKKQTTTGSTSYLYDSLGNLISTTLPGGTKVEYIIDGEGRRIGRKVNGNMKQGLLYKDGLYPLAELNGNGELVSYFVYATRTNIPDYMVKGAKTYAIISDELGSPRLIVDIQTGNIAQQIDYDEFGMVINDTNPGFQPFGFAGGLYDMDTKLVRFGARDYDAQIGRWTAKDPILFNGGDTNLYGYVVNDPVNLVDPSGLLQAQHHFWITFVAGVRSGKGIGKSFDLAWNTQAVDKKTGSQGTCPAVTKWHGMAGIYPDGSLQTRADAIAATNAYIQSRMANGDLAEAVHAAQDLVTPVHMGNTWRGPEISWENIEHALRETFPSPGTLYDAYQATEGVLK